jgi:hypothetical protein
LSTGRINAVTYGANAQRYGWSTPEAARSLEILVDRLDPTHVVLPIMAYQDTVDATEIDFRSPTTVDEQEVLDVIERLHAGGRRVILKPMLNVRDGTWRAYIKFFDVDVPTEPTWSEWFKSYTAYQLHFARLAAKAGVEMFVVGCEMCLTEHRETEWRTLIAEVRRVYPGLISYNCDKFQEDRIQWWDACDVIASSGYYPHELWAQEMPRIEKVVHRFQKPFVFLEVGCRNVAGAISRPGKHGDPGERSDDDQRRYFEALFAACEPSGFVSGYALWGWPAELSSAPELRYCPYERPAEATIRELFTRTDPRPPHELGRPLPPFTPRLRIPQRRTRARPVRWLLKAVRFVLVRVLAFVDARG